MKLAAFNGRHFQYEIWFDGCKFLSDRGLCKQTAKWTVHVRHLGQHLKPEDRCVSLRFFIEFFRRHGLQMKKTTLGAWQLYNWIAYRFVEIKVGFGPTKWNIVSHFSLAAILASEILAVHIFVPGRKNSSFHFAVWEAQKAAASWQGKGGTLHCWSGTW